MRITFINTLHTEAKKDSRIILLTGDLGFSIFENYMYLLPDQFLNSGIAEQNMTGVAAGLAMENRIPVIFSIIPFVTMRNFEQIRNDICCQNLNVKIVGIGAGFTYPTYQRTHYALEDIGILRTLPNLTIICPGDPVEVKLATIFALKHQGPVYIRLGKAGEPCIHNQTPKFTLGKGIVLRIGKDVNLIATSTLLNRAYEVAEKLTTQGIDTGCISMPFIKPLDSKLIIKLSVTSKALFTLEEHSIIGGLGSSVAEVLAENQNPVIFRRLGVPDRFTPVIGSQEFMQEANGLTLKQLVVTIKKILINQRLSV